MHNLFMTDFELSKGLMLSTPVVLTADYNEES